MPAGTPFRKSAYDWNGELKFQIDMPEWNTWSPEPEGINIIDGHILCYCEAKRNYRFEKSIKKEV